MPPTDDAQNNQDNNAETPTTGNAPGNQPQSSDKMFTQDDVNRIAADARKSARSAAVTELLKELAFDTDDDLKGAINEYRQQKQAQMSEVEKLQTQIDQLQPLQAKTTQLETDVATYQKTIQTHLEFTRKELTIPDHVAKLLDNMPPTQQLEYLTENKAAFQKNAPPNTNAGEKGGTNGQTPEQRKARSQQLRQKYGIKY